MASKDAILLLDDIIKEMELIAGSLQRRSIDDLYEDRIFAHGLKYSLLVIGEATKRIPMTVRAAHPDVPWDDMIRTRDFIAHGYDRIMLSELWHTLTIDVPAALPAVQNAFDAERRRRKAT